MELRTLLNEILEEVRPLQQQGQVAQYIRPLALVPRSKFGLAVVTLDGEVHAVGDAEEPFSTQSISKVFTLTLAFQQLGEELWRRVGREPSGTAFNSLVQLESERGIPRNPFINAGALVVDDILLSRYVEPRTALLDFVRRRAANPAIGAVPAVAEAERETGFRNAALANFLKSFGNLERAVDEVLAYYFFHCSLAMSCVDLARSFAFLAHRGICPRMRERLLSPSQTKRINALLLTCGTYDAAGDFAYEVGIPAKSGVGGGIVGIIPDRLAIAVWSPALNAKGNSLAGTAALERFTTRSGLSVF